MIKYFILIVFTTSAFAQTTINPDISAIGTFNTFTNNIKNTPEFGKLNFETPGLELFIEGYLNPYSRAVVDVAYEDEEFALEEIYAEILRGLPLDIQVKAGKYLLGFGKLNTFHPHTWPFLHRPLSHQIFLGEEGFNDIGIDISFILPFEDFYSDLNLGIFKGDAIRNTLVSEGESITDLRGINPIVVGRWGNFFTVSDFSSFEMGLSSSYGAYTKNDFNFSGDTLAISENKPLYYLYGGVDFKYKYSPGTYTALTIQGEGILNHRDVMKTGTMGINTNKDLMEAITTFGALIFVDYKFLKKFSVGAKYDYTYGIIGDEPSFNTLGNDDKNKTTGIYGWFGFYPVEETLAFRLELEHLNFSYKDGTKRDTETTITLQMLFSLGPHKAHPF